MKHEFRHWLLERAASLSVADKTDLKAIVRQLNVAVVRHESVKNGESRRLRDGRYEIRVAREKTSPNRIRFTVAHELAHILLDREFGLRPSSRSEYWRHEDWCDEFAGALLVPSTALAAFDRRDAIGSCRAVAENCGVSLPVVARRAIGDADDMAFVGSRIERNARHERVLRIIWSAGRLLGNPQPRQHLSATSRLGRTSFAFIDGHAWRVLADAYYPQSSLQMGRIGNDLAAFRVLFPAATTLEM
jgi:hypothetical protein